MSSRLVSHVSYFEVDNWDALKIVSVKLKITLCLSCRRQEITHMIKPVVPYYTFTNNHAVVWSLYALLGMCFGFSNFSRVLDIRVCVFVHPRLATLHVRSHRAVYIVCVCVS